MGALPVEELIVFSKSVFGDDDLTVDTIGSRPRKDRDDDIQARNVSWVSEALQ